MRVYDGVDVSSQIGMDVLLEQGRKSRKVGDIPHVFEKWPSTLILCAWAIVGCVLQWPFTHLASQTTLAECPILTWLLHRPPAHADPLLGY